MHHLLKKSYLIIKNEGPRKFLSKLKRYPITHHYIERHIFHYYTIRNTKLNKIRYKAAEEPYKTLKIDPKKGDQIPKKITKWKGLNQVKTGDWDQPHKMRSIDSFRTYRGLKQRFQEGLPWKDTQLYERAVKDIRRKGSFEGYTDPETFLNERCNYLDKLYSNIKENGYQPNSQREHSAAKEGTIRHRKDHIHRLEPLIAIGRDGEISWMEGLNRMTIARILGIEEIPVQVIARHKKWQRKKDEVVSGNIPDEINLNHPDLSHVKD